MAAYDLVDDMRRACHEGRLGRRMKVYLAPKVLIVDEMGYLPLDERGSIILTSNSNQRRFLFAISNRNTQATQNL